MKKIKYFILLCFIIIIFIIGKCDITFANSNIYNLNIILNDEKNVNEKKNDHNKYIYLTFDDGPSYTITSKILDILKKEDVKATFFVIHHDSNLNYLIKREYEEGHSIGLHSYTHSYKTIYKSIDSYFKDLNLIKEEVYNITGIKSNLVRFPGGTSNTISRRYNRGIMTKLIHELENRNMYYFDWNISSGDASSRSSKQRIYNNVVKNLRYTNNVVLMHDFENNYATLNALEDIILYGKEHGFIFKTLDYDTVIHHKPLN